jgi:hypothetical protein
MNMLSTRMFFDRTVRNVIATKNRIRHAASSEVLPSPPPTIEDRRYLTATNPRLHALAESYTAQAPAPASIWAHWLRPADFLRFRGESVFVSQLRYGNPPAKYASTAVFVESHDPMGLLQTFDDDGSFGAIRIRVAAQLVVTRDMLDSILELGFLRETLGISPADALNVLDIGAGYGRLTSRLLQAFPNTFTFAADGVAASSFICEYYLRRRGLAGRFQVGSYRDVGRGDRRFDFAMNVASWSEVPLAVIRPWLEVLNDKNVRTFFFVPHEDAALSRETDHRRLPIIPVLKRYGFTLETMRDKYMGYRSMAGRGIFPTPYMLFVHK